MNCREAQDQIFAERDGAPDDSRRAALDGHVAHCADCRRIQDDLTATFALWRTRAESVTVPDAEREWHAVRRQIRGGVEAGTSATTRSRWSFSWFAVPLGAAAALALALYVSPPRPDAVEPTDAALTHGASAESIDVPGSNASTMVFVDDKSGWLVVWASDGSPKSG